MEMFYIKMTILNDFPLEEEPISQTGLDSFYVSYSPLSVTNISEMAMFCIKLTIHNDFDLEEEAVSRTGQFNQSLDSFYVTDSP